MTIRLLLAIFCALGLALAPVTANAAAAPSGTMPGCTMDGKMPHKPVDHSKMDCCTPACQIASAAALLPQPFAGSEPLIRDGALHRRASAKTLASFISAGLDPPPRTILS